MPVDWTAVIEGNRGVLKRVLAELVAMAAPTQHTGSEGAATLPRHLHTAILRVLRPAEAAARRLIVVVARGIVVTLPAFRPRPPQKTSLARKGGTGIILPRGFVIKRGVIMPSPPPVSQRTPSLPLFDPRKRFFYVRPARNRGVPRISDPVAGARFPIPVRRPPLPDGRVRAARIHQRLATLAAALDDLPGQAKRFARLRALRLAAHARQKEQEASGAPTPHPRPRALHVWPLRPGHPPGWTRRPKHEVDDVLKDLQYFAREVLEQPDTS